MSKNDQSFAEMVIADTLGCAYALTGGSIALIFSAFAESPEIQLRQLGPPSYWGVAITQTLCSKCGSSNESDRTQCRVCGQPLDGPLTREAQQARISRNRLYLLAAVFVAAGLAISAALFAFLVLIVFNFLNGI